MDFPLHLPLLTDFVLLLLAERIQQATQQKRGQHDENHDENILIDRSALLLDSVQRHIADQKDRPVVDRPNIVQRFHIADIVVKENVLPVFQSGLHFGPQLRALNAVGPIKIFQIQMPCVALPHSCGFEHKPLGFRVHDIKSGLFVVKAVGQRTFQGIIGVFHIEVADGFAVPDHGAFHGIGPSAHVIDIRLGDRQPLHRPFHREIQSFRCERFPTVGNADLFPGQNQRQLHHGIVFLIRADVFLRVFCQRRLLGDQFLKLRLFAQNRFDGILN